MQRNMGKYLVHMGNLVMMQPPQFPTKGIPGSIAYLAKLRTEDGVKVEYKRKGCTHAENINHPVDMYEIRENEEYVCMLHLCPYYKENSAIAPKGFKVISLE